MGAHVSVAGGALFKAPTSPRRTAPPTSFSRRHRQLLKKYLPSFACKEPSNDTHRRIADAHWNTVFHTTLRRNSGGGGPSSTSTMSSRNSSRRGSETETTLTRLYDAFYRYVEHHAPELVPVFRSSMQVKSKVLAHICSGVRNLLCSEHFLIKLLAISTAHHRVGVKLEHYEPMGKAFLHALKESSGDDWNTEVEDAWRHLYAHASVVLMEDHERTTDVVVKTKIVAIRKPSIASLTMRTSTTRAKS